MTAVTRGDAVDLTDVGTTTTTTSPSLADRMDRLTGPARVLAAFLAALVLFGVVMLVKGVNPITAYVDMVTSTFNSGTRSATSSCRRRRSCWPASPCRCRLGPG